MLEKIAIGTAILLSLLCMPLAFAPFTPAVGLSLLLLLVAGFIGYRGWLRSALVMLFLNTLAVIGSPGIPQDSGGQLVAIVLIFTAGFGGVYLGLHRQIPPES